MSLNTKIIGKFGALIITAAMEPDDDTTPSDSECYSEADIAAFQNGSWRFVGIVVTVTLGGAKIGSDSLWGTEFGKLAEVTWDPFATHQSGPLSQTLDGALGEARSWVERFCGDDSAAADLVGLAEQELIIPLVLRTLRSDQR